MKDETDMEMPMSGDGEMMGEEPVMEPSDDAKEKRTYEKPLKIHGAFNDALRVLVGKPPAEK